MAPSASKLKDALRQGTSEVFEEDPDGTSVNKVRRHVEEKLGLEEGSLTLGKWKQMSKELIKEEVAKLLEEGGDQNTDSSDKRQSSKAEATTKGRNKAPIFVEKATQNEKAEKSKPGASKSEAKATTANGGAGTDTDLTDLGDNMISEEETRPKKKKPAVSRRGKQIAISDSESELSSLEASPPPTKKRKRGGQDESDDATKEAKEAKLEPQSDTEESDIPEPKVITAENGKNDDVKSPPNDGIEVEANDEDEYSDVLDDAPPTKSKSKAKRSKETSSKSKPSKSASKKAAPPDDSKDAEVKKLQSQLTKCGVRKLWHNELKQYGENTRAKIQHLKRMLADVGMDGRFSEAKAREIKEMRELRADVEAAQEMNKLWGMDSGGRASRSKSKSMPVEVAKTAGEEGEDDDQASFAARRRRAHADLAFLGDESDSD